MPVPAPALAPVEWFPACGAVFCRKQIFLMRHCQSGPPLVSVALIGVAAAGFHGVQECSCFRGRMPVPSRAVRLAPEIGFDKIERQNRTLFDSAGQYFVVTDAQVSRFNQTSWITPRYPIPVSLRAGGRLLPACRYRVSHAVVTAAGKGRRVSGEGRGYPLAGYGCTCSEVASR